MLCKKKMGPSFLMLSRKAGEGTKKGKIEEEHRVYTIGHSTRTIDDFVSVLNAYGIEEVVDIRTVPRSRHNPQFNKDVLPESLKKMKIRYLHVSKLGGLRKSLPNSINKGWRNLSFRGYADYMQTDEFQSALEKVVELAKRRKIVLMCAESVPWRCHRSLVADALLVRRIPVTHILSATSSREHKLTPWAKVKGRRVFYPQSKIIEKQEGED